MLKHCSATVIFAGALLVAPASAQDGGLLAALFGAFRIAPAAPPPASVAPDIALPVPQEFRPRPRPIPRLRAKKEAAKAAKEEKVARLPAAPKVAAPATGAPASRYDPKTPPLVALLRDPTLRRGDIVVFPDGPRVFEGEAGNKHAPADFVKLSAAKSLPKTERRLLANMRVFQLPDAEWAQSDKKAADKKVAESAPDVETTGSVRKSRGRN